MEGTDRRRRNDKLGPLIAVGVVLLLAICSVLSFISITTANTARHNTNGLNSIVKRLDVNTRRLNAIVHRLDVGAVVQCQRVQRLRDDVNAQANNQFDVIKVAARASPTGAARELYRAFLAATPYSPPTDCRQASSDPLGYRAPPVVMFAKVDACYSAKNNRPIPPCRKRH